ncbi:ATP-binding protein [bacterium]|nr:ATP-binding protein [bacterium]
MSITQVKTKTKTFVLKGGPQSGKSTILKRIEQVYGDRIIVVPEVATVLLTHLWPKRDLVDLQTGAWMDTLQHSIFHTQQGLERLARVRAQTGGQVLIGHDRGVFDNAGYLGITGRELARMFGANFDELMGMYDLVIHLDTLAKLYPEQFGSETNEARYETVDEAIAVDERIWQAYAEHPHQVRIAATDDFEAKVAEVMRYIDGLL